MPRPGHVLLDQDLVIPKRGRRFAFGARDRFGERLGVGDQAHASAAAARRCLDQNRIADAIGGGSQSRYWLGVLANILNLPLSRLDGGEAGGALGAARLGRMAATGESAGTVCTPPKRIEAIEPRRSLAEQYESIYRRYRSLYPCLKEATT